MPAPNRPPEHINSPQKRSAELRRSPLVRFPLLLGGVAGIALCALGLVTLTLLRGQAPAPPRLPPSDTTVQAICSDLRSQNYAALYNTLASRLRSTGTEAQFAASQHQLDITLGAVTQCNAEVMSSANGQANVQFTLTRARGGPVVAKGHLAYEGGAWRLDTYDARLV